MAVVLFLPQCVHSNRTFQFLTMFFLISLCDCWGHIHVRWTSVGTVMTNPKLDETKHYIHTWVRLSRLWFRIYFLQCKVISMRFDGKSGNVFNTCIAWNENYSLYRFIIRNHSSTDGDRRKIPEALKHIDLNGRKRQISDIYVCEPLLLTSFTTKGSLFTRYVIHSYPLNNFSTQLWQIAHKYIKNKLWRQPIQR